jgi:hypothetical protein
MSSSAKRRQTMAKVTRERAVKEKRALKAERKEARKLAAAEEAAAIANGTWVPDQDSEAPEQDEDARPELDERPAASA